MKLPIPKVVERRLRPLMKRGDDFLRDWEWTWTTAFIAGIALSFIALTVLAVIPSWMLYFAEQTLEVKTTDRIPASIRDAVVNGFVAAGVGAFIVGFYKVQVRRRQLRGEKQADRYTGGYR